ncbi:L,D-transpeptidase [uncultured Brevundimonas sp.]|uniref:L,D-transpeptidase n=1 Tax=uncultured Brevundimonas sp. TaxID=213418 RepID=UPI0026399A06|nr:L,D-transpeptidase [uncultured Brevundimonas sp.]
MIGRCATAAGLVVGLAFAQACLADEHAYSPEDRDGAADATGSSIANEVAAWVRETADNQGLPFLVIDKINAQVLAYDGEGRLLGAAPALMGLAPGDVSPPGIGDRPLSAILPQERITPAGRFLASLGENLGGNGILWIDYDAALSLHPVITTRAADRRLQRLATASAEDNRISYGCVNVPVKFYEQVVEPAFNRTMGVVYILPEHGSPADVFFRTPGVVPSTPDQEGAPLD